MACNGDSQTLPYLAKKMVNDLFQQQSAAGVQQSKAASLPGQWCTLTPKDMKSLDCTPSHSSTFYLTEDGCEQEVKTHLEEGFDKIFTDVGHMQTFWEDFSMNLSHKLGLTYREAQKMDGTTYNEAKLKYGILHPILTEVSKAACIHPKFEGKTIKNELCNRG